MTEEEIDWAVRLYGDGRSLNAVARTLGKAKGSMVKSKCVVYRGDLRVTRCGQAVNAAGSSCSSV
ncbi:hypothetical protein ACFYTF_14955, partial [Nocardia thailandica]